MAKIPLEIIDYTSEFKDDIRKSISIANSSQNSINLELIQSPYSDLNLNKFEDVDGRFVIKSLINIRNQKKGFHPFLLAITDKYLYNEKYYNLFSTNDEYEGIGVFTTHNVPEEIIPKDKMVAYFLYYFVRNIIGYMSPENENHDKTKGCLYDTKEHRIDILSSMKEGALCSDCRDIMFMSKKSIVNETILQSLDEILRKCKEVLKSVNLDWNPSRYEVTNISREKVRELISKSEIIEAIEAIKWNISLSQDKNDSLLLFESQYNRGKKNYLNGLMTLHNLGIEQTRITMGLIELIK